jgi:prepilin-type N-terminal cleavage/methylation domain-containing protein
MGFVRQGNAERGFTLIEIMAVVVIVAILAAVVVPSFMQGSIKSKARTEAAAMIAEIGAKQAQFYAENSKYMGDATQASFNGTTTCPSAVPSADYVFETSCSTTNSAWQKLRVVPTSQSLRCQYTLTAGLNGTNWTPPTGFKNSQGALNAVEPTQASSWWYVHVKCDNSGSTAYSEYYASSVDRKIQSRNEGN